MYKLKINKDVDAYKESIIFGFNAREFICCIISLVLGVLLYFFLKRFSGINDNIIAYIAFVVIAPVVLMGFKQERGMYWDELIMRKKSCKKMDHPFCYDTVDNTVIDNPLYWEKENMELHYNMTFLQKGKIKNSKEVKFLLSIPKDKRMQIIENSNDFIIQSEMELNNNLVKRTVIYGKIVFSINDTKKEFKDFSHLYHYYDVNYVKNSKKKK